MLKIWTGVEKTQTIERVFKPALSHTGIEHKFYQTAPIIEYVPKLKGDDLLMVLGTPYVKCLKDEGILPGNLGLGRLRETLFPFGIGQCMVSYSPTMIDMEPERKPEIMWDARLAVRYLQTGSLAPQIGNYEYTDNFDVIEKFIDERFDSSGVPVTLSWDLETIGKDEFDEGARIVSVSMSVVVGKSWVYYVPVGANGLSVVHTYFLQQLDRLATSEKVKSVGANLKFDNRWLLKHWAIRIKNQKFDTFLVGSLLDENIYNSLNIHAKMLTDMGGYDDAFNKKYDKAAMHEVPKDALLPYAGGDTDACLRVAAKQRELLTQDSSLTNFYIKQVQPVSEAFTIMEHRGVVVDQKRYDELEIEVSKAMEEYHAEALAIIPRPLRIKYRDNLSLTRPELLKKFLFTPHGLNLTPAMFTPKEKEPSTSKAHLQYFDDPEEFPDAAPFIQALGKWNSAKKTHSTYIIGFRKHLRSDGRFHPTYWLAHGDDGGTDTGRSSAKDPAWQTTPKHTVWAKPLRSVYTCPPGFAILKADYSQGELRVTACVSNEPNMLEAYKQGIDLHLKTGASLNGYELAEALLMMKSEDQAVQDLIKDIRQGGKIGNFGLIYGMYPKGLKEYARTQFGVDITLERAVQFRETFFETYPGLITWHNQYKKIAGMHGQVRSPLGRVRHLPLINSYNAAVRMKAERQAINSPIQGTLSDMCELSIALLYKQYPDLWVFGFTHDEIQIYVPEDDVEGWAVKIRDVMENLPLAEDFDWHPQLPFPVDFEYSHTNLAECKELKLAA